MEVEYDENTNTVILRFSEEGTFIGLPANHDTLGLWKKLGIPKYQRWLWEQQNKKCAECDKPLLKPRGSKMAYLHHDPPLGALGSRAVDYKRATKKELAETPVLAPKAVYKLQHRFSRSLNSFCLKFAEIFLNFEDD